MYSQQLERIKELKSSNDNLKSSNDNILQKDEIIINNLSEENKNLKLKIYHMEGILDARYIMELYEKRFKKFKSRKENWKSHLKDNNELDCKLQIIESGDWSQKVVEIYQLLSTHVHERSIQLLNEKYLIPIKKGLPTFAFKFIQILGKELFSDQIFIAEKEEED